MCKIAEEDLLKEGFKKDYNRKVFNICPELMYRKDYFIDGDACPIFITKYKAQYCHVVPANNSIKCAFVPIQSVAHLKQLISALSGVEINNEK